MIKEIKTFIKQSNAIIYKNNTNTLYDYIWDDLNEVMKYLDHYKNKYIYTICAKESEDYIVKGICFKNAIGYFVTEKNIEVPDYTYIGIL